MGKVHVAKPKNFWHFFFFVGLALRGLNGLWETFAGFFIFLNQGKPISQIFQIVAWRELQEDPNDVVANFVLSALNTISLDTKLFIAAYFLVHGLLNIFLTIQLARGKMWAYKLAFIIIILAIGYQAYRVVMYHSWFLAVLTLLDIVFFFLLRHEYRQQAHAITKTSSV